MCRGRRARILLHLHIQREKIVLRGSRAGRRSGCRNHPSCVYVIVTIVTYASTTTTSMPMELVICEIACGLMHIRHKLGSLLLHQPPWSFGFDSQTRGTRENRYTLCSSTGFLTGPRNPLICRYGEAPAAAASWRAHDGGRQRRTACPLLYRYRHTHTYCSLARLPPTHPFVDAPILQWHFQVR